jgi:hypothetical protein
MTLAAAKIFDLIKETSVTTGVGDYLLAGSPAAEFRAFSTVCANGDRVPYTAVGDTGGFECGIGTYNSGPNTLTRTAVLFSSNANAAVNWVGGKRTIDISNSAWCGGLTQQKHNLIATTAPGVGNDNTQGYDVLSHWINRTTSFVYICTDAATGAAVWARTSAL